VIKSRRMRWAGHVACMGEQDGRIILKWLFKKWDGGMDWIGLAQDREGWQMQ